jgi:hypothetical protein
MRDVDDQTKDFMASLTDSAKAGRNILRVVENPKKALPRLVQKQLLESVINKEAGLTPLKLLGYLNDHHALAWWDWEPETLWQTLAVEHGIEATDDVKNMVMALQNVVTTNAAFEHWHIFEKVGHAFFRNPLDFHVVQPMEPDQAAGALKILHTIRPQEEFSPEIWTYVSSCCHSAGLVYLPPELFGHAQAELARAQKDWSGVGREVAGAWPRPPESDAGKHQFAMLQEIAAVVGSV